MNGLRAIPGVKCTMPEGAFYAYPNISSFFGKGGMKSASDVAGRLLARGPCGDGARAKASGRPITFVFPTRLRSAELDRGLGADAQVLRA